MPEFKLPNEYGFKEKVKVAKLRGGKKEPKQKKEKKVINLGGENAAPKEKKAKKGKKEKVQQDEDAAKEETTKEEVKKEVSKMSLDALLASKPSADGAMSMAERMAKMRQ